jgi:hypothetical protein
MAPHTLFYGTLSITRSPAPYSTLTFDPYLSPSTCHARNPRVLLTGVDHDKLSYALQESDAIDFNLAQDRITWTPTYQGKSKQESEEEPILHGTIR